MRRLVALFIVLGIASVALPAAATESPVCRDPIGFFGSLRVQYTDNSLADDSLAGNSTGASPPSNVTVFPQKPGIRLGTEVCAVISPSPGDPYGQRPKHFPPMPFSLTSIDAVRIDSTEIAVTWGTNGPASIRVAWGYEAGGFVGFADVPPSERQANSMIITGLAPDAPLFVLLQAVSPSNEVVQAHVEVPAPPRAAGPSVSWLGVVVAGAVVIASGLAQSRLSRQRK